MFYDFNNQNSLGSYHLDLTTRTHALDRSDTAAFGALLADCRRGDRAAQKSLYRRYYAQCMTVCSTYTADPSEALDRMNTAWERIYRRVNRRMSVARFEEVLKRELKRQLQPGKFRLFSR